MTDRGGDRPWWTRREFMRSSAAAAAGMYAMRWANALAADVPNEFDGSKFQLKAAENGSILINLKTRRAQLIYDDESELHDLEKVLGPDNPEQPK